MANEPILITYSKQLFSISAFLKYIVEQKKSHNRREIGNLMRKGTLQT